MIFKLFGAPLTACVIACVASLSLAADAPVAKLMQPSGMVEYSVNGASWRPAPRIKYLFEGYMIRTGGNGSAKLVDQQSGMAQTLGNSSQIVIKNGEISLENGDLSEPEEDSTSIWQSILNKFSLAQKYTTVRRSGGGCDSKVQTVDVSVSARHPELVWRNACPEYHYRLIINDRVRNIPPEATSEMIRYSVGDLTPGVYKYKVEVVDVDGIVFRPRKLSEVEMISADEERKMNRRLAANDGDVFMQAAIFSEHRLYVAAMDLWRDYFHEFPEENDMRPMLAAAYARLRLEDLQQQEARLYQSQVAR